jgi:hypothetical protein
LFTNDLVSLASLLSAILFPGGENKVIEISIISSEIIPLLIQSQLKVGDSYFQISPVIQINLFDFVLLPTENIVSRYLLKEDERTDVLTKKCRN